MTKYRLKKDLPTLKAGAIFSDKDGEEMSWGSNLHHTAESGMFYRFYTKEIDNFDEWFEPVADEWPQKGDTYWTVAPDGTSFLDNWGDFAGCRDRRAIGNVFKTEESAQRFVDYLKAVEAVRHDEGFMKMSRKIDYAPCGYGLYQDHSKSIVPSTVDCSAHAGEFYFDTYAHAQASLDKHRDEWQTILDYDWSKE